MLKNLSEIEQDMSMFLDWEDKYEYIIELGKELPEHLDIRDENHIVEGCMANVWLVKERNKNGTYSIKLDGDAIIVRGLLYIMSSLFDGKTRQEIVDVDAQSVLQKLALDSHLSSQRLNGLSAVIKKIQNFDLERQLEREAENEQNS